MIGKRALNSFAHVSKGACESVLCAAEAAIAIGLQRRLTVEHACIRNSRDESLRHSCGFTN